MKKLHANGNKIGKAVLIKQGIIEAYDYWVSYNYKYGHNIADK